MGADRRFLTALDGVREKLSIREIGVEMYGAERVAEEWHSDSAIRSNARYWRGKARDQLRDGPPDPWPDG